MGIAEMKGAFLTFCTSAPFGGVKECHWALFSPSSF
jgi:hypothetical protein